MCISNINYAKDLEGGRVGAPTVRVVRKGTFTEYRAWKIKQMGISFVQAKVPIVTWDKELVAWLEERVDTELGPARKEQASFIDRLRSHGWSVMPCLLYLALPLVLVVMQPILHECLFCLGLYNTDI
jgi:hypothetical protein